MAECQKEGLPVKFVEYNAFKYETYQVMLETVIKAEGRLDILVNNFGTGNPKKDLDLIHGDPEVFFDICTKTLAVFIWHVVMPFLR